MQHPPLDSRISKTCYAIVFTPSRRRSRFPENCVEIKESAKAALEAAAPEQHRHPAHVIGPSRSSEGVRLYYLIDWLDGS
ncbi:hypothetical protein [endosymbiont of Ridgeia piscesae]|jgi:hypothetical protein|uniref:Uncharacterized protein n=1 Tax=endosymbiont of Ridgeia piscesae TaxID=54398 RepID=A0A0T5Z3S5_9GAMM|nr:hypothetical protein [endosymbiont of Ridgeia piscesae]KRT53845.1 hypothetical protein Ga0074115_101180 [endosymbiont of Ridgeia piscesae]KRT57562.1 hypothetical protein Ga0076813_11742 [endosymbiont of Ridgeia piscesae]